MPINWVSTTAAHAGFGSPGSPSQASPATAEIGEMPPTRVWHGCLRQIAVMQEVRSKAMRKKVKLLFLPTIELIEILNREIEIRKTGMRPSTSHVEGDRVK